MRTVRFFCDTPTADTVVLDSIQSRHLHKVLRLRVGDPVELFDGKGLLAEGSVEHIRHEGVCVRIVHKTFVPAKDSGRVILAVSLAKGERYDWMIEKCTELGADHIVAVHYERTVKLGKSSVIERYRKIALSASKQCGRVHLPLLSGPDSFINTLGELRRRYADARILYGAVHGQWIAPDHRSDNRPDYIVCIGPEGGFSDTEIKILSDLNALPVCLNPHILRIETAAIAFTAVLSLQSLLSDQRL